MYLGSTKPKFPARGAKLQHTRESRPLGPDPKMGIMIKIMLEMTLFCRFFAYSCLSYKRATTWSGGIIQLIFIADLFQFFNCRPSGGWHISKVADIGGLLLGGIVLASSSPDA